ncbi:hypothetical protein INT48_000976 [Thamnidium elegans]|uniref:Uncharacterized protein n=1 Tax=Thamnidium elegans TaxID=101142 RepID=A0A8H7SJ77_9FUNG|nr:hypothetical protein INT48_000976 [Thamnidium elegans]
MSGQNYIGSKISLISLSDIRYVGVLHNINSAESTVALQNVQSFGTEGRKASINEEIAPSDNIFDYVVFRGSDIKDLQVFEAPPSYKPEPVVQQNMQQYAPYATQSYGTYWQNGNIAAQPQMQMPVPENYRDQKSLKVNDNDFSRNKQEKTVAVSPPFERRKSIHQEKQEVLNVAIEDENSLVDSLVKQVSDLDIKKPSPKVSKSVKEKVNKKEKQKSPAVADIVSVKTSRSTTRSTRTTTLPSRGGNNRNRSHGSRNGNNTIVPRSDFDFASSNAKFDKTEITVVEKDNITSKGDSTSEPENFYNKKKSFFDDISCDSKESNKSSRRVKYQEECKLNLETFGQKNTSEGQNGKRHRHRGRDRGRSSREKKSKPPSDNNAEIVKESA